MLFPNVAVTRAIAVRVAVTVGTGVAVRVAVSVGVSVGIGVGVCDGVSVGTGVGVAVAQLWGPLTQMPPLHVSLLVQALPSSQGAVLLLCVQPLVGSQESSVHGLVSSQSSGVPFTQLLLSQRSKPSQMSWLSQSPSVTQQLGIGGFTQPLAGSQ